MSILRTRNKTTNQWEEIQAIKGDQGPQGIQGPPGENYVITQNDYQEIANVVKSDIQPTLDNKVDKVSGKGLSTNDYTTDEKNKLAGLSNYDDTEVKSSISDLQTNKADRTEIPTKTSDLTNDSGFITNLANDLVNYYLKDDTYTKEQVNDLISAISTMDLRVVEQLPTQDISTTTIYLVPKATPKTNDVYDEYIYVSNDWEHIGSTEVDLTDYVKNTDYGTANKAGVLKQSNWLNIGATGFPYAFTGTYAQYKNANGGYFIGKGTLENVIEGKGLISSTDYATNSKGGVIKVGSNGFALDANKFPSASNWNYTQFLNVGNGAFIGKGTLENVITGKGLVSNTDYATSNTAGVSKVGNAGISINPNTGLLYVAAATDGIIDGKSNAYLPIVPRNLDYAVKTGITTNTITLTATEKDNIRKWLGLERSWRKIRSITIDNANEGQTVNGVFYESSGGNGVRHFKFTTDDDGNSLEGKGIISIATRLTPTTAININQGFIKMNGHTTRYFINIKNTTTKQYFFDSLDIGKQKDVITSTTGQYMMDIVNSTDTEIKSYIFFGHENTSVLGQGSKFDIWAYGYWD